jgi:hypothetical protein
VGVGRVEEEDETGAAPKLARQQPLPLGLLGLLPAAAASERGEKGCSQRALCIFVLRKLTNEDQLYSTAVMDLPYCSCLYHFIAFGEGGIFSDVAQSLGMLEETLTWQSRGAA